MEANRQIIRDFYNRQARQHPDSAAVMAVNSELEREYRVHREWIHFKRIVHLSSHMRALELGCGAGRWVFEIARHVDSIVGVDISEEVLLLAEGKRRLLELHNASFALGDIAEYRASGKYDLIYFSGVLSYIECDRLQDIIRKYVSHLAECGTIVLRETCMTTERKIEDCPHGESLGRCPSIYRVRGEYVDVFRRCGLNLVYANPSYTPIRPRFLSKTSFFNILFRKWPESTMLLLHTVSTIAYSLLPPRTPGNNCSHDFMVFSRETT